MRYYHKTTNHAFTFIALCLILLAASFFAYDYISGKRAGAQDKVLVPEENTEALTSAAPLNTKQTDLLNRIEAIKLDGTILKDKAFLTLQNWTVVLGQQEVGKINPFAPLSGVKASTTRR